ncbi:MAG: cyclic lactone autoinducer peptide [Anaerovoracaceae bacterium]
MTKTNPIPKKLASILSAFLSAILLISANTGSSMIIYQPAVPSAISRFKKIK